MFIYAIVTTTRIPLAHVKTIAHWSIPEVNGELIRTSIWFKSNASENELFQMMIH